MNNDWSQGPQNTQINSSNSDWSQGPQNTSSNWSGQESQGTTSQADPVSLIQKYFPESEWANAEAVMNAESGGNPQAVGDNYPINGETIPSVGLFQIRTLPGRPTAEQLSDPEENVKYAAQMQAQQGWQPWTTARNMGLPGTTPLGE